MEFELIYNTFFLQTTKGVRRKFVFHHLLSQSYIPVNHSKSYVQIIHFECFNVFFITILISFDVVVF